VRVAVFCGSSRRVGEPYTGAARRFGAELGARGHALIYGGGGTGLMGVVADAALEQGARVQGVILDAFIRKGVHHPRIQELHPVGDMRARKAGLDERAEGFVALPGGLGTLEELAEILSFRKLDLHRRTLVFLNTAGFFDPLLAWFDRAVEAGFDDDAVRGYFGVTADPIEALDLLERA